MSVLIGSDPEFFVGNGDKIISVIGLLGGSKEEPLPVKDGALQEDNVLAEINIHPATSCQEFMDNLRSVRAQLDSRLHPYKSVVKSSHFFEEEVLLSHPKALEFGCDPDYNCWTGEPNQSPDAMTYLRTAGGHIHIGYDNPEPDKSFRVAQMCDVFLGIPSVLLDDDRDRRNLYGKAGACRIKAYGVEYRTLSNFWLKDEALIAWAYEQAMECVNRFDELESILEYISGAEVQDIINTGDRDRAEQVIADIAINLPGVRV